MDRKFYMYSQIQYQWYGFFGFRTDKYYKIMLYEENGNFYELLTGQFLGKRVIKTNESNREYIFSNEFGYSIPLSDPYYSSNDYARTVTAEDFARQAREYMGEKSKIVPYINMRFEKWRIDNRKRLEQERLKRRDEEKKKIEDSQNTDWLSNILDKRK